MTVAVASSAVTGPRAKIYDNFVTASKDGIIGIIAWTMSTLTD